MAYVANLSLKPRKKKNIFVIYDDGGEHGLVMRHATGSVKKRDSFCLKWGCKWKEIVFFDEIDVVHGNKK